MDPLNVGTWLLSALAVPAVVGVCIQLFAERSRREHLRLARDQLELADLLDDHAPGTHAEELRRRASAETARYLRPPRRPRYVGIVLAWTYSGGAIALLALAEIQTAAEAGPGAAVNWIIFGVLGILLGALVAAIHIALKDQVLNMTNRSLALITRERLRIPRPQAWPPIEQK